MSPFLAARADREEILSQAFWAFIWFQVRPAFYPQAALAGSQKAVWRNAKPQKATWHNVEAQDAIRHDTTSKKASWHDAEAQKAHRGMTPTHKKQGGMTLKGSVRCRLPTITYMHVCENEHFGIGIFCIPAGVRLPFHDHPQMTVISR